MPLARLQTQTVIATGAAGAESCVVVCGPVSLCGAKRNGGSGRMDRVDVENRGVGVPPTPPKIERRGFSGPYLEMFVPSWDGR